MQGSREVIMLSIYKPWKGVQSNFLIEILNLGKPNDHVQRGIEIG